MNEMIEPASESQPENEGVELASDSLLSEEKQIDLNEVFPEEENDLNDLFPDEETRLLLKRIQRTKKDLSTMNDRFTEEDWTGTDESSRTDTASNESPVATETNEEIPDPNETNDSSEQ